MTPRAGHDVDDHSCDALDVQARRPAGCRSTTLAPRPRAPSAERASAGRLRQEQRLDLVEARLRGHAARRACRNDAMLASRPPPCVHMASAAFASPAARRAQSRATRRADGSNGPAPPSATFAEAIVDRVPPLFFAAGGRRRSASALGREERPAKCGDVGVDERVECGHRDGDARRILGRSTAMTSAPRSGGRPSRCRRRVLARTRGEAGPRDGRRAGTVGLRRRRRTRRQATARRARQDEVAVLTCRAGTRRTSLCISASTCVMNARHDAYFSTGMRC